MAINKLILEDFLPSGAKSPVVLSAFRISECPGQSSDEETDEECRRVEGKTGRSTGFNDLWYQTARRRKKGDK